MTKEFRTHLTDDELNFLNQLRHDNPAVKTNHDLLTLLMGDHVKLKRLESEKITNIDTNVQAILNILGELMLKALGFRDVNNLPVTETKIGSQYLGVKAAIKTAQKQSNDAKTAQKNNEEEQ